MMNEQMQKELLEELAQLRKRVDALERKEFAHGSEYLHKSGDTIGAQDVTQTFNNEVVVNQQITADRSGEGEVVTGFTSTPDRYIGIMLREADNIRADIRRRDNGLSLVTSSTTAAPGAENGIHISNAGTMAIGTLATSTFVLDKLGSGTVSERLRSTNGAVVSNLDAPAGNLKDLRFLSGQLRWVIRADDEAESGSNAGTNFRIIRYSDAGTIIDTPIYINRATGRIGINTPGPLSKIHIIPASSEIGVIIQANGADTLQLRNALGGVMTTFRVNGAWKPAHLTNAAAANDTVYYSTTNNRLVYKNSAGTVNNLY
jgi:hypothetical protein